MTKKISYILIGILALVALGFFLFLNLINRPKTPPEAGEIKALDYKKLEKLESLKHPGVPVSVDEPGFGREDPFAPY